MSSVLVLDGNQRSALATVRSLGSQGFDVYVADCTENSLAGTSRFCRESLTCPSPLEDTQGFLDWLTATIERLGIDILLPVTEVSSQILLHHRERLPEGCHLPFAEVERVLKLSNKIHLMELAEDIGVPHPTGEAFTDMASYSSAGEPDLPFIIKPARSVVHVDGAWHTTAVSRIDSQADLQRLQSSATPMGAFLRQVFIPGHGAGVFAIYDRGQPLAFFAHRRLREKPPGGGVSVLSEAVKVDSELLSHTRRLLDAVDWHGVAMVEFRIDPEGRPWLMEVNTRFWGSLQLAIDAGVDFPKLLCDITLGKPTAPVTKYNTGQRLRWLLGDVDSLYLYLRDGGYSAGEKLRRIVAFLTPRPGCTRHEVNRIGDMRPAWFELKGYVRDLLGRDGG